MAIASNDAGILYSPYTWDVTAVRAKTINAGAYFRTIITGSPSSVVLNFDMTGVTSPVPKITWEIDGVGSATVDVAATVTVTLPTTNTWGKHTLKVTVEATSETVDRWNAQASAVQFTGITTTGTATAPTARPLKALILGDSITEGVRALNMNAATDTARNSSRNAWSTHLGGVLDAEVGVVGFGSTGISQGGSGGTPALSGFWNTQWASGPSRGVAGSPPDYVVINMGTNDPDATDITAGYTAVLNSIHVAAPNALIFCLLPFEGSHAAHIQAARAAASDPARCIYVNTTGWWSSADGSDGLHLYGYTAPAIARLAATQITTAAGTAPDPAPSAVNGFFFDLSNAAVPMSLAV